MNPVSLITGYCQVIRGRGRGRAMFANREDAKTFARIVLQPVAGGRGKAYRCQFGDHYHVTRSYMGRRARCRKDVK